MLDELEAAMIERLRVWEQKNKTLPERVFVYRDGVSEVGHIASTDPSQNV